MKINPKLTPEQLRERGERYVQKARQYAERAEAHFRAARRRERALEVAIEERMPWPCIGCGFLASSKHELDRHLTADAAQTKPPACKLGQPADPSSCENCGEALIEHKPERMKRCADEQRAREVRS
jgi:hypothetical protein